MSTNFAIGHEDSLLGDYMTTRQASLALCANLEVEDFGLQAMPDVSPPKWHLAHTSWFFETFILKPFVKGYREFHPGFEYLFNSYYNTVGAQYPRPQRGLLSRPTLKEVFAYRDHVDHEMVRLLQERNGNPWEVIRQRCELGLHHEQQHQELICTDIKYSFSFNPLYPSFGTDWQAPVTSESQGMNFLELDAVEATIGYQEAGFHFDNETPAHTHHQTGFRFADRLVTNAEYLEFMQDGGYGAPVLWLADGWAWCQSTHARHPRYWIRQDDEWYEYTLQGLCPLDPNLPVSHVNYYEADAFSRWSNRRLPSEQEWELVCRSFGLTPKYQPVLLHPQAADRNETVAQMFGHVWQWTRSAYSPYPGYRPARDAIGEYNGKFMCNQMVLRGSSCVTPPGHARPSYRNFFYPKDQWQFTGIRLADDL